MYYFTKYDVIVGETVHSQRPATLETIVLCEGKLIEETAQQVDVSELSARTKIFLYVKILSTFTDLQPSLFATLINKKDMLTGAIYSKFTPRNSQLAP